MNIFENFISNEEDPTHLLLNGGKLHVPENMELSFLRIYAKALTTNQKLYVVECRPQVFKLMIDVDLVDEKYWTKEQIVELTKKIQNIVFQFYEFDSNVICCTAPQKETKIGIKTGIHLIWPKIYTCTEDAILIRNAIVQHFQESNIKVLNSWEDVFDRLIYERNGYRMVGSDKLNPKTRKPENRSYWPTFAMDSNGELRENYINRLLQDFISLLIDTSIRYVPSNVAIPINKIPEWVTHIEQPTTTSKTKNKKTNYVPGNCEFEELRKFIDNNLPRGFKNQNIKSVKRYEDDNLLIITDSRFCMNISREHNSCGIYFFATPKGLFQKCLCPCEKLGGRKFGYCRDFTSKCYKFTPELSISLFPNQEEHKPKEEPKDPEYKLLSRQPNACDRFLDSLNF